MPVRMLASPPFRPNPRALRTAYLLALGLLALLVLAGQMLASRSLSDLEQDGRAINLAGRQRMLYLTLGRAALVLGHVPEAQARAAVGQQLGQALEQWERVHQGLLEGDGQLGLERGNSPRALELLESMEPARRAVLAAAREVLAQARAGGGAGPELSRLAAAIQARGDEYLLLMDQLVLLYDQEATQRVRDHLLKEWLLTGALLLGLALVGLFIFRPMARRLTQDMEELSAAARSFEQLSLTDGLTGLANRRALDRRLSEEWRRAWREGHALALLMLDLDHFKAYNDSHGHQEGDRVLGAVANVLKAAVRRPGDLAARYGGEEMVALLVGADLEGAMAVAQELRQRVEGLGLAHGASPVAPVVTVSLGVAAARPRPGSRPAELLRAADQALYQAKAGGRNQVVGHTLDLGGPARPLAPGA
ncbi:MAG: diguanylate cyclase [Desulfarculus sp.]|nr:diguanylate cyclase [Desulfarculus sp.]